MKKIQTLAAAFGLICAAAMAAAPAAAADMASFKVQKHHEKVIKDCTFCHTQENAVAGNAFVVPDDKQCMSCHGTYEALAKKTDKLGTEPASFTSLRHGNFLHGLPQGTQQACRLLQRMPRIQIQTALISRLSESSGSFYSVGLPSTNDRMFCQN